jgi:hypothetical protein
VLVQTGVGRDKLADLIGGSMALQPLSVLLVAVLVTVVYEMNGIYGASSCALSGPESNAKLQCWQ